MAFVGRKGLIVLNANKHREAFDKPAEGAKRSGFKVCIRCHPFGTYRCSVKCLGREQINYREALANRLSNLQSCFVLDAGTGAGNMTKVLTNHLSAYVVSVDVNRHVFQTLRGRVDRRKIDFVACDFASLPFKEESFCCIVCDLVISTSENWQSLPTYMEFRRTLRTNGILYITDYYPEDVPRNKEDKLAAETWKFYRDVSKAGKVKLRRDFPPEQIVADLRKAGYRSVREEKIIANESAQWKKSVFKEYYNGMKRMISGLNNSKLRTTFLNRLETLKNNIVTGREIHWGWGVNYLIEAQK